VTSALDVGRTAVYAAEEAAFGGTELDEERPLAELVAASVALTTGAWWQSVGAPRASVSAARADARSSAARTATGSGGAVAITLADGQRTLATLGHELAHAFAGVHRGHDATFRAAHVDVIAVLAGGASAAALATAYRRLGVPAGVRRWAPPVRMVGDGFAVLP
jgi:hypothetical protein